MMIGGSIAVQPEDAVRIGFITDLHSADKATSINRYYRDGIAKLTVAMGVWNAFGVDAVYENGDFVDQGGRNKSESLADLATVEALYSTVGVPRYYGFGNHCLETLTKAEFMANTGMSEGYYHFDIRGIRFIVLDPCFRSDSDADPYAAGNYTYTTAYIPPNERAWLSDRLAEWSGSVVIFCHYRLIGPEHVATNAAAVRSILSAHASKVKAVISGHAHTNSIERSGGIPYITAQAATGGAIPNNAFAVIEARQSGVRLIGYRGQTTY